MKDPTEAEVIAAIKVRRACEDAGVLDQLEIVNAYTAEQLGEASRGPTPLERAFSEQPVTDVINAALRKLSQ